MFHVPELPTLGGTTARVTFNLLLRRHPGRPWERRAAVRASTPSLRVPVTSSAPRVSWWGSGQAALKSAAETEIYSDLKALEFLKTLVYLKAEPPKSTQLC